MHAEIPATLFSQILTPLSTAGFPLNNASGNTCPLYDRDLHRTIDAVLTSTTGTLVGKTIDGLLGMDFLHPLNARLLVTEGIIELP